jgi:hypothetical protein
VILELDSFGIDAAVLRRSEQDMRAFLGALAVRLESALPGRTVVETGRQARHAPPVQAVRGSPLLAENTIEAEAVIVAGLRERKR